MPSVRAYPYIAVPVDAAELAFTEDEVRVYLGYPTGDTVSFTDQEAQDLMLRAQAAFERCTWLTLFDTNFTNLRDFFDTPRMQLRRAPIQSITSINHLVDNVLTVVDASEYKLTRANQLFFGNASLKEGESWPGDTDHEDEVVEVKFLAGFGPDETSLPEDLKAALLRIIADLHANKGDCSDDDAMSSGTNAMARKFKIVEI